MLELIFFLLLGIAIGILTGLIPGLHTNLISSSILLFLPEIKTLVSTENLLILIVSFTVTNVFFEFIPSIFLGAPDEDVVLSVLPGQKLLLKGKGSEAVHLSSVGAITGIILFLPITILFLISLKQVYPFLEKMMGWTLIWISIYMIYTEKNKILSSIIFLSAGFLGIGSLNLNISQPLLPLLTGLFGASSLIISINSKTKIPKQEKNFEKTKIKKMYKLLLPASIVSIPSAIIPGLGSSQSTMIGSKMLSNPDGKQFLVLNGTINSLVTCLSFSALFLIQKGRTGSAAIISQILNLDNNNFFIIIFTIIISSFISFFLVNYFSKKISTYISRINYSLISWATLIFLVILVFLITGLIGLIVLIISTFLGLTCQKLGVRRSLLMGCLIIPTTLYYLPF